MDPVESISFENSTGILLGQIFFPSEKDSHTSRMPFFLFGLSFMLRKMTCKCKTEL